MRNTPRLCEMQLANEPLERAGVTRWLNAKAPAPAAQRRAVRPDRTMSHVELATFDNGTGEGIVSFEPSRTSGPEYDADHSRWYHHLLVAGQRVFEYGCPCGTCGIVFRKVGTSAHRPKSSAGSRGFCSLASIILRSLKEPSGSLSPGGRPTTSLRTWSGCPALSLQTTSRRQAQERRTIGWDPTAGWREQAAQLDPTTRLSQPSSCLSMTRLGSAVSASTTGCDKAMPAHR